MARMNSGNGKKQRLGWQRAGADGREDFQKHRNSSKNTSQSQGRQEQIQQYFLKSK